MPFTTIIGRGHSGTRMISHTLYASGVHMGACLNKSGDLIPGESMYAACRVFAKYVDWKGGLQWDFNRALNSGVDPEFKTLVERYLGDVLDDNKRKTGWKLPETTLVLPWIIKLFPDLKYVYLVRDPRDSILKPHLTDDLRDFGIAYPETNDIRRQRAISWLYQYQLVEATPKPKHWLQIGFEDFITNQETVLQQLEDFLEIPLARVIVRPDSVGRYKQDTETHDFDFLQGAMAECGYQLENV